MAGPTAGDRGVHRLVDMVVEEVSLVDRAANKHRFLIVKRSQSMDDPEPTQSRAAAQDAASETGNAGSPEETDDLNEMPDDYEDQAAGAEPPQRPSPSLLGLAAEALEALTGAVEVLGTVSEDQARQRVAELADELRALAERLGAAAGAKPATDEPPPGNRPPESPGLDAAIATVRTMLERIGQVVASAAAAPPAKADQAKSSDAPSQPPQPDVAAKLDEVAGALRALGETVKEQQQRLARMEKRFGLPNSAPTGERRVRADDDGEVGWPLDLNRPFDRESVDKAISFHDV
jgi:uncharacterized coiled-coil protein SlyX